MTRTAKDRINEFTKRQVAYRYGMIAKLHSVKGYWHYEVIVVVATGQKKSLKWVDQWKEKLGLKEIEINADTEDKKEVMATISGKYRVIDGKYNGEDPNELFDKAESIVGKWKLGKQVKVPVLITEKTRFYN